MPWEKCRLFSRSLALLSRVSLALLKTVCNAEHKEDIGRFIDESSSVAMGWVYAYSM